MVGALLPNGTPGELQEYVVKTGLMHLHPPHRLTELARQPWDEFGSIRHFHPQDPVLDESLDRESGLDFAHCGGVILSADGDDIPADLALELLRCPSSDDLAVVDDGDVRAKLGFVHVMSRHKDGGPELFPQLEQVAPDVVPRLRIEAKRGLIEKEDLWPVKDAARDLQASAHAAGESLDQAVRPIAQLDDVKHFANAPPVDAGRGCRR